MSKSEHRKTIKDSDGTPHEYHLVQHGAREGLRLLPRVLKVAAGPISALKGLTVEGLGPDGGVDVGSAGDALGALADALLADDASDLVERLLEHTTRDGQRIASVFNSAYQGNYTELIQAVIFAAMANFGDAIKRVPFGQGSAQKTNEPSQ